MVTLLVVDAIAGNGNLTVWANGIARPATNNLVWGGSTGRASTLAVTGLDGAAKCQVAANLQTNFVLDVIGYYL